MRSGTRAARARARARRRAPRTAAAPSARAGRSAPRASSRESSGSSSPLPDMRSASMPSSSRTPCAAQSDRHSQPRELREEAVARRRGARSPRAAKRPLSARAPGCRAGRRSTTRATSGPRERFAPSSSITIAASIRPGFSSLSTKRRTPASPRVDPSTLASTTVLRGARPSSTRASSSSAAVSAALPARSGTSAASRPAITTICRRDAPGRVPTTLTSSVPSSSQRVHLRAELTRAERTPHQVGDRAVALAAGPPVRRRRRQLARLGRRGLDVEQDVAGQTLLKCRRRASNENATSSTASAAGRKAAR